MTTFITPRPVQNEPYNVEKQASYYEEYARSRIVRGTATVPTGSGITTVAVTGLDLPSSSYHVSLTPNTLAVNKCATVMHSTSGFTIQIDRTSATAGHAIAWAVLL